MNLTVSGGTAQVSAGTLEGADVQAAGQLMLMPENDGDYSLTGAGGHTEAGWRLTEGGWSVTPYAAFTGFATDSKGYGLSNGMRAEVDTTRLLRGEAGAKAGWRLQLKGVEPELWVKAAVRQEYADANRVKVNEDGDFVNTLSGTSGVYEAGLRASHMQENSERIIEKLKIYATVRQYLNCYWLA